MKKRILILLCLLLAFFSGCESRAKEETQVHTEEQYGAQLPVSRALAAKMLALGVADQEEIATLDHQISFADVGKNDWFYPYVNYVCAKGYMQGTGEGFLPEAPLTGGQAARLLSQLNGLTQEALEGEETPISLALWTSLWLEAVEQGERSGDFSTVSMGVMQTAAQGGLAPWYAATTEGTFCHGGYSLDAYVGKTLEVVVKGEKIVAIVKEVEDGFQAKTVYCRFLDGKVELCSGSGKMILDWPKGGKDGVYDVTVAQGSIVEMEALEGEEKTVLRLREGKADWSDGTTAEVAPRVRIWDENGVEQEHLFCGQAVMAYWQEGQVAACLLLEEREMQVEMALLGESGIHWADVAVEGTLIANGAAMDGWQTPAEEEKTVLVAQEGTMLTVTDGKRSWDVPQVTVWKEDEGYVVVASLSEDAYLAGVVAGQMVEETGEEAAKAQAVVARSQLWNQQREDTYLAYGAQVDSSSWQPETERSRKAVEETEGLLLWNGEERFNGTFFAVSCGSFAAKEETWPVDGVFKNEDKETVLAQCSTEANLSLTEEMTAFLNSRPESADSQSSWYRWESVRSWGALTEGINSRLALLSAQWPLLVKVRQENGQFLSVPVQQVGEVTKLAVSRRGMGGNVMELILYGTEEIVLLRGSDVICQALGAGDVVTMDGETHWQGNLPSPFFVLEEVEGGLRILGGGYGHGVGMSQEGARRQAQAGASFREILAYFYPSVSVGTWKEVIAPEEKN